MSKARVEAFSDGIFAIAITLLVLTVPQAQRYPGVFGEALRRGRGTGVAAVAYSILMALSAYAWALLWLHASRRRRLLNDSLPEPERRLSTLLFTGGCVIYTLTVVVAFLDALACLAVHAALAAYYAVDPLSWARRRRRRAEA